LAVQYAQNDHTKEALELLLTLLRKDLGAVNGEARKAFTDILQSMEKGDALAAEFPAQTKHSYLLCFFVF